MLTYKELVSIMTKCHKTIEVVRKVPTGTPGPAFPNARLLPGVLLLLVALLHGLGASGCTSADQLAGWPWRG